MTIIHRRAFFFGVDRTACDSVRVREFRAVVNALSVSMGIKITYGSYVKKDVNLGKAGTFVDARFFITAIFATLTSCISILESIAANCVEIFHTERKRPSSCSASFISRRAPSLHWATACSILSCRFPTWQNGNNSSLYFTIKSHKKQGGMMFCCAEMRCWRKMMCRCAAMEGESSQGELFAKLQASSPSQSSRAALCS